MKAEEESDSETAEHEKQRPGKRVPSRYDILIQCRDEAEQRELFERLRREGVSLRLLVM